MNATELIISRILRDPGVSEEFKASLIKDVIKKVLDGIADEVTEKIIKELREEGETSPPKERTQ
jgi:predicted secreted protein